MRPSLRRRVSCMERALMARRRVGRAVDIGRRRGQELVRARQREGRDPRPLRGHRLGEAGRPAPKSHELKCAREMKTHCDSASQ